MAGTQDGFRAAGGVCGARSAHSCSRLRRTVSPSPIVSSLGPGRGGFRSRSTGPSLPCLPAPCGGASPRHPCRRPLSPRQVTWSPPRRRCVSGLVSGAGPGLSEGWGPAPYGLPPTDCPYWLSNAEAPWQASPPGAGHLAAPPLRGTAALSTALPRSRGLHTAGGRWPLFSARALTSEKRHPGLPRVSRHPDDTFKEVEGRQVSYDTSNPGAEPQPR